MSAINNFKNLLQNFGKNVNIKMVSDEMEKIGSDFHTNNEIIN